jgi:hypothetical protein
MEGLVDPCARLSHQADEQAAQGRDQGTRQEAEGERSPNSRLAHGAIPGVCGARRCAAGALNGDPQADCSAPASVPGGDLSFNMQALAASRQEGASRRGQEAARVGSL